MKISKQHISSKGFTLIEMVVVMGIIAVLAGGAITALRHFGDGAKVQAAANDIKGTFGPVLQQYQMHSKKGFPTTQQGLAALQKEPTIAPKPKRHIPQFKKGIPTDPWGNDYVYTSDGREYELKSKGPDGELGTDDDISSED